MNSTKKVVLGLTGYYCSGKSAVEKIIKNKYNFQIIDVDKVGHEALEEKKDKIINAFGKIILIGENIDRKKLGKTVFADKKSLKLLNSIVHPLMVSKVKNLIEKSNNKLICINAALLFDMNLDELCNTIFIINSGFFSILKRAKQRDHSSLFRTLRIINSQKGLRTLNKSKYFADICYINNNKDLNHLEIEIDKLLKEKRLI